MMNAKTLGKPILSLALACLFLGLNIAIAATSPLTVVTGLSATPATTSISIAWSAVAGATSYDLEVDGSQLNLTQTSYRHQWLKANTQHAYRVRARADALTGPWSQLLVASTGGAAPVGSPNTVAAAASDTTISLSWPAIPDAESYDLKVDSVISDTGSLPRCTLSGLTPDNDYTVQVRPRNSQGVGEWSQSLIVRTHLLPTPDGFTAAADSHAVVLTWAAVSGATGYQLEVDSQVLDVGSALTYTHAGLTLESTHRYRLRAIAGTKDSGWTDALVLFTPPEAPAAPASVHTLASEQQVKLSWEPVPAATEYDVELDGVMIENGASLEYLHAGLAPFTSHTYRVRGRNSTTTGAWSPAVPVMTLPARPVPPSLVRFLSTSNLVEISWQAEPGALGYDLEINGEVSSVGANASFTHRRLQAGQEYAYRLRTRNILGVSDWTGLIVNNSVLAKCRKGEDIDLGLAASNVVDFSQYRLSVSYRPEVLEVTDLSLLTAQPELSAGRIAGTEITVTEFEPGQITFVVDKVIDPGYSWTGVINSIQFRSKVTGGTTLTYTVFCDSEGVD